VVGAERLLVDSERALVERLALCAIEQGEVVEGCPDGGVLGAERLLKNGQRAFVERLGLGVAALGAIELGDVRL
jgi:hypothetical protein